ncbi:MAG: proline--tRNA ligase [Bacteroidetes bacterium]|nr:proline--tRNA ligase [Bacteroidota bacterium]
MAERITKRADDYAQWYLDVVLQAQLADYAPVKGCMIIRPNGYAIWENIQKALDGMFKDTGHVNAYFPLFIPESFMMKEKEHVEGFSPECAVVTHGGGKKLEENLYVRPTSETIIWSMYKKWIHSYRDLPILINQWANVVRWEMRTRLFLRTTEFLWQEGHTAHATYEEAEQEALKILEIYRHFAEDYMAIPVFHGKKTESEKFAGALHTYCIEAMMQDKKALQAGTSHNLGQNFAKAFEVQFQDEKSDLQYVWATSWGVSTRLVGALIMAHSDDNGLVLPPKLAPTQVVIVPIFKDVDEKTQTVEAAQKLKAALSAESVRVHIDDRDQYRPGWKFNEWELKGIPVRVEIGPKDLAAGNVVCARRDKPDRSEKVTMAMGGAASGIVKLLADIQKNLYDRAKLFRDANIFDVENYDRLKELMEKEEGFARCFWAGSSEDEARIKDETKATIRCIPVDQSGTEGVCIFTGKKTTTQVLFAKAY